MTTRLQRLHQWLSEVVSNEDYQLHALSGDASFRHYFRLEINEQTFVVMDAPIEQEDSGIFVDVCQRLCEAQINVPKIVAKDLQQGFILLSDLGEQQYFEKLQQVVMDQQVTDQLYHNAMQTLLQLQQHADHRGLPLYDKELLVTEMQLFKDWLLQKYLDLSLTATTCSMLDDVFEFLVHEALVQPKVFVHRDYHSRNLMVSESAAPGVLDFQDAVYGPLTYDLVSLLKDCYIDLSKPRVQDWARKYFAQLEHLYTTVDEARFMRWFDLMGVQRHLKASGIFARLYLRDGKAGYLADIPLTLSYIIDLQEDYPELQGLIELLEHRVITAIAKVNH